MNIENPLDTKSRAALDRFKQEDLQNLTDEIKLKLKKRNGLTDDLKNKIDVFFAVGRITEEQYNELMDVNKEEELKAETN